MKGYIKCPINYYSGIKKNEILPFVTKMNLEGIMLSEINLIAKDIPYYLSHAESKKRKKEKENCRTHRCR